MNWVAFEAERGEVLEVARGRGPGRRHVAGHDLALALVVLHELALGLDLKDVGRGRQRLHEARREARAHVHVRPDAAHADELVGHALEFADRAVDLRPVDELHGHEARLGREGEVSLAQLAVHLEGRLEESDVLHVRRGARQRLELAHARARHGHDVGVHGHVLAEGRADLVEEREPFVAHGAVELHDVQAGARIELCHAAGREAEGGGQLRERALGVGAAHHELVEDHQVVLVVELEAARAQRLATRPGALVDDREGEAAVVVQAHEGTVLAQPGRGAQLVAAAQLNLVQRTGAEPGRGDGLALEQDSRSPREVGANHRIRSGIQADRWKRSARRTPPGKEERESENRVGKVKSPVIVRVRRHRHTSARFHR